VLPVALDRHLKERPSDELAAIVVQSCANIGLPKEAVDGIEIEMHKRAPVKGAPSALEVCKSLPQDSPYRGRPLAHMVLTFERPIRGPIVLGAGRFRGLGLFLALDDERP
jgi:CRISPR-associated protein Csb2